MELIGPLDLNGHGDRGDGIAFQQWPDGRHWLYLAHEASELCAAIDPEVFR